MHCVVRVGMLNRHCGTRPRIPPWMGQEKRTCGLLPRAVQEQGEPPAPRTHTHTQYNNISNPGEKEVKAWISVKRSAWLQFISQPILPFVWCVCALKLHFLFSFFFVQEVKNAILDDIVRLGKEGGLKSFEQVS